MRRLKTHIYSLFILHLLVLLYLNVVFIIIFMQIIHSGLYFFHFLRISHKHCYSWKYYWWSLFSDVCQSNLLNPSKTDFLLIGLPEQLYKLSNPIMNVTSDVTLSLVPEARNLGVLFDSIYLVLVTFRLLLNLIFLILGRRIRPILNQITARNITTALLHSKLDYYNYFSIFLQINWIVFSLLLILLLMQSLELPDFII